MNSNNAVQAEGLSKCYRVFEHPRHRLLQAIWGRDRLGRRKNYFREFWALQELSFSLQRGQTLGVIGRNGSGKSTLLQLLCGTLEPTTGSVLVQGRVGALLELGSGFNPEFSGLENIYFNASLLGLSKTETQTRLDRILGFADIGEFIHQPVKTYSSGMAVRLAFAVQANIDPDVLVVDEALAVGDELFQKKCYAHLERLKETGTSVLLVTHSCPQIIQHCDQALLLHKGKARLLGEPAPVTVTYQRLINASDAEWEATLSEKRNNTEVSESNSSGNQLSANNRTAEQQVAWLDTSLQSQSSEIYPSHGGMITDAWINQGDSQRVNVLPFGDDFILTFSYQTEARLEKVAFACHISSHTGRRISGQSLPASTGLHSGGHIEKIESGSSWSVSFHFHGGLWPGLYFIGGGILTFTAEGKQFVHRVVDYRALRVLDGDPVNVFGACSLQSEPPILEGLSDPLNIKN